MKKRTRGYPRLLEALKALDPQLAADLEAIAKDPEKCKQLDKNKVKNMSNPAGILEELFIWGAINQYSKWDKVYGCLINDTAYVTREIGDIEMQELLNFHDKGKLLELRGRDYTGSLLENVDIKGAVFIDCNISSVKDSRLVDARLTSCTIGDAREADFTGAYLSDVKFNHRIDNINLSRASLLGTTFNSDFSKCVKVIQMGRIDGSKQLITIMFFEDRSVEISAGCFYGTLWEFEDQWSCTPFCLAVRAFVKSIIGVLEDSRLVESLGLWDKVKRAFGGYVL